MRSVTFLIILNSCWLFGEKLASACCLKMVFIDSESYFCCMQNSSMMRRDLNQGHFTIEVSWKKQNMIPFLCQTLVGLVYFIFIMVNGNFEVEPVVPIMRYLFFTNTRENFVNYPLRRGHFNSSHSGHLSVHNNTLDNTLDSFLRNCTTWSSNLNSSKVTEFDFWEN